MADRKDNKAGDTYRQTDLMHLAKNRGISMDDARDLIEGSGKESEGIDQTAAGRILKGGRGSIA